MKCPFCGSPDNKVVDKRETKDLESTRRRRECLKCNKRFTTYEKIENIDLFIVKKDGRREQFKREKLKTGLLKACEKRPISVDKIDETVLKIEAQLKAKKKKEILSKEIGNLIMRALKKIDKVAYIRFASVYREFEDLSSFKEEIQKIDKKRRNNRGN